MRGHPHFLFVGVKLQLLGGDGFTAERTRVSTQRYCTPRTRIMRYTCRGTSAWSLTPRFSVTVTVSAAHHESASAEKSTLEGPSPLALQKVIGRNHSEYLHSSINLLILLCPLGTAWT